MQKPDNFDQDKDVYAYIWGEKSGEYSHVYVRVFNLGTDYFDRLKLEITSQGGGDSVCKTQATPKLYAFRHGMSGNHSDMMTLREMEQAVKVMRKINKKLGDGGYVDESNGFARYAIRVLEAAGVKHFFINERFARGFSGSITEALPYTNHPLNAFVALQALEKAAIEAVQPSAWSYA